MSELTIRAVRDAEELARAFDVAGAAQSEPCDRTSWMFDAIRDGFPTDRDVNMVAERRGHLIGAALSFRDEGGVRVRILGVTGSGDGRGAGRMLLEGLERAAWAAGDQRIYLGAQPEAVNFYRRCGYSRVADSPAHVVVFEKTPLSRQRLAVVRDAPWLPEGSDAEMFASDGGEPPEPVCLVRVCAIRGDEFFLIETEKGPDLPTRFVAQKPSDGQWKDALTQLCAELGTERADNCLGFVRNVVPTGAADYPFPTPHAHFAVFDVRSEPAVAGEWRTIDTARGECGERHWWPVVEARLGAQPA